MKYYSGNKSFTKCPFKQRYITQIVNIFVGQYFQTVNIFVEFVGEYFQKSEKLEIEKIGYYVF